MKKVFIVVLAAFALCLCGCSSLPEGWSIQIVPPINPQPVVVREVQTVQQQPVFVQQPQPQITTRFLEK